MKIKLIICGFVMLSSAYAQVIAIGSITSPAFCHGSTLSVDYSASGGSSFFKLIKTE